VDLLEVDYSLGVILYGKGSRRVGLAAGVAAEALDGSYDPGVVEAYLAPIGPIL
jgi:hypothetical protein